MSTNIRKVTAMEIAEVLAKNQVAIKRWIQLSHKLNTSAETEERLTLGTRSLTVDYMVVFQTIFEEYATKKGPVKLSKIISILNDMENKSSGDLMKKKFGEDAALVSRDQAQEIEDNDSETDNNEEMDTRPPEEEVPSTSGGPQESSEIDAKMFAGNCGCSSADDSLLPTIFKHLPIRGKKSSSGNTKDFNSYPTTSSKRGHVLMINLHQRRNGANYDDKNLKVLFNELKYEEPTIYNDELTKNIEVFIAKLKEEIRKEKPIDSIVVFIGGHGGEGVLQLDDGHIIDIWKYIIYQFDNRKCYFLTGIPKIFFIQTCLGETEIGYDTTGPSESVQTLKEHFSSGTKSEAKMEDTIVCYATIPGYIATRFENHGTLFVLCLYIAFMENADKMHLSDLIHKTGQHMQEYYQNNGEAQQCHTRNFAFKKNFYFNP